MIKREDTNEAIKAEVMRDVLEIGKPRPTAYYVTKFLGTLSNKEDRKRAVDRVRKIIKRMNVCQKDVARVSKLRTYSFGEMLQEFEKAKNFQDAIEQRPITLKVGDTTNDPRLQLFLADTHIGARGVDYTSLRELWEFILLNPFIKVVTIGDLYDNFIRFMSLRGANDAVAGPSIQIEAIVRMLTELHEAGQLDAAGMGNHTIDREEKGVGYSVLKKSLVPTVGNHVFEGMGELSVVVGGQEYRTVISHKGMGNSATNPCHGAVKLQIAEGYPDVVGVAHRHTPAVMQYYSNQKQLVALRTGSHKISDSHTERYFNRRGSIIGTPCVIYMPDEHRMIPFLEPKDAVAAYKGLMGYR